MKKYLIKIFIDEIYNTSPRKNNPTTKKLYIHINGIWSVDLADFSD